MEDEMSLEELIEKIQETKDPILVKRFSLLMGFLLHEKDYLHIIFSLILNLASGLFLASVFKSLLILDNIHPALFLLLAFVILTIIEFFMKKIIISKMPLVMLYTAGQIFTLSTFLIIGLEWLILPGFGYTNFGTFLIFVCLFCLLRLGISLLIRKTLAKIIIGRD